MHSYGLAVSKIRILVAQHRAAAEGGHENHPDPAIGRHHKQLALLLLRYIPNRTQRVINCLHCRSLEPDHRRQQSRQYFVRDPVLMALRIH